MVYLIFGSQYPLIKRTIGKILKERIEFQDDFSVVKFDMDKTEIDDALIEAEMLPLGYERKAVILDNFKFLNKSLTKEGKECAQKVITFIENPIDEVDL
ncbi:MAG: hypothetical protein HUJ61_07070, partial [Bacilli bacterium]|nr:hypothetical protein [Bacilli bacterium]